MGSRSPAAAPTVPDLQIVDVDESSSSSDESAGPSRQTDHVDRPESTGFALAPPSDPGNEGETDQESLGSVDEAAAAPAALGSRGSVTLPDSSPMVVQLRETAGGGESVTVLPAEGELRKLSMAAAPPGVTDEELCEDSEEEERKAPPPTPGEQATTPVDDADTVTFVAGKQTDRLSVPVPEVAVTTDEEEVTPETASTSPPTAVTSAVAETGGAGAAAAKPSRRRRGPRRRSRQKDRGQTVPQQMTFIVPGGDADSDDAQSPPAPAPRRRPESSSSRRSRQTPSPSPELSAVQRRLHRWPEGYCGLEELCGLPTDEEYLSGGEDPAVGRSAARQRPSFSATAAAAAAAAFFSRLEDLTGRVSSLETYHDPDQELREIVETARRESLSVQEVQRLPNTDGTDLDTDSTGSEEWDLDTALRRLSTVPSPNQAGDRSQSTGDSDLSDEEGWSLQEALRRLSVDASLLPSPRRNMVRISDKGVSEEPLPEGMQPKDELSTGEDTEGEDIETDGYLGIADMPRRPSTPGVHAALTLLESTLVVMEDGEKLRRRGMPDFKSFSIDVPEPAPLREGETFVALPGRKKRRQKLDGLDLASLLTDTEEVALGEVYRRRRSSVMVEYLLDLTEPSAKASGQETKRNKQQKEVSGSQESGKQEQTRRRRQQGATPEARAPPGGRRTETEVPQAAGRRRQGGEARPAAGGRKPAARGGRMQNGTK
ncbi:hypothetical protein FJT64_023295 [Amphibalanus amphitrite]|uniref:Uncharacterized protein n=1 Tax=Amphibalanus amphitrite TaxID=1232801 RepID=A0A6A4WIB6_AMPAM|nr:hypothetical protein FJT64_023295 [Amphibalanus amphitrite]